MINSMFIGAEEISLVPSDWQDLTNDLYDIWLFSEPYTLNYVGIPIKSESGVYKATIECLRYYELGKDVKVIYLDFWD